MIIGMHMMCLPQFDAKVSNATNQYWGMLGMRFLSVHNTDDACNGGY